MKANRGWRSVLVGCLLALGPGIAVADIGGGPVDRLSSASATPGTGFMLPLAGDQVVLTPFRPPKNRYGTGHRGVDLAGVVGARVLAAGSGTVVFAGLLVDRGVVSVQHAGALRTTYEPVSASVTAGQRVVTGQQIGVLEAGHPSCAPASCLHWGARIDTEYLDPLSLLRPWRVRLLPWDG